MADVSPIRTLVQFPGVQFNAAVSENMLQEIAEAQNFLSYFQYSEKRFVLDGPYSIVSDPQNAVDGLIIFEFQAQILDVWMWNMTAGSSGTTELDLKLATSVGGSFSSIFTTTPKISYLAGNNIWVGNPVSAIVGTQFTYPSYTPPANTTQPVLNRAITDVIPAFSALRLDKIQSQVGGQDCGIVVHYRNV